MSVIADLPDLRPSLLLDFANSRRVHPLIQCTRASTATCFGPDGKLRAVAANVPRIDYDPVTRRCLGLLVEEGRTNLLLQSGDVSAAPWTGSATDSAEAEAGLDGVVVRGWAKSAALANRQQTIASVPSGPVSFSFAVWNKGRTGMASFSITDATGASLYLRATVDTVTGTVTKYADSVSATVTVILANGVALVQVSITNPSTGVRLYLYPGKFDVVDSIVTFFGMGQVEVGAFPTSYISSAVSAVTRAADLLYIDYTLPTVGAIVASVAGLASANTANAYLWSAAPPVGSGADHAYCYLSSAPNRANWWVNKGGVGQSGGNIVGRPPSIGVSFDATARAAAIASGSLITKDTIRPRDFPANLSQLRLGCSNVNSGFLGGCISRLAVYSGRITDAQLQRLTA